MRSRYFFIISSIFFVIALFTTVLHNFFLEKERRDQFNQIDLNLTAIATNLLNSDLGKTESIETDRISKLITETLGDDRVGKFFIVRDANHKILFKSRNIENNIELLWSPEEIPEKPKWVTHIKNDKYIRVLNLDLPLIKSRTLQVGLVMDTSLVYPNRLHSTSILFFIAVLVIGFLIASLFTTHLLKPLDALNSHIQQITHQVSRSGQIDRGLIGAPGILKNKKDEFNSLVQSMETLLNTIDKTQKQTRIWTYQVAHELKTPLSIMNVELDKAKNGAALDLVQIETELNSVSRTINSFLDWAELENSSKQRNTHAIWVSKSIRDIIGRFDPAISDRIKVSTKNDFCVLCNPHHFQQTISNLVINALKYSPPDAPVEIVIDQNSISIKDTGSGIQKDVLSRFGEPFNRGTNAAKGMSHGLGLAWVSSVSKLYNWAVKFESSDHGTTVGVSFNETLPRDA